MFEYALLVMGGMFMQPILSFLIELLLSIFKMKQRLTISSGENVEKVKTLMRLIKEKTYWSGTIDIHKNPIGIVVGKWFIAYVTQTTINTQNDFIVGYDVRLYSRHKFAFTFMDDDDDDDTTDSTKELFKKLNWYEQTGPHRNSEFRIVKRLAPHETRKKQEIIVDEIIKYAETSHKTNGRKGCSAFISGLPGTGKSAIAERLALRIEANICMYDPTKPGVWLPTILEKTGTTPLVLLINEGDRLIEGCYHESLGSEPDWLNSHARTKSGWNNHLDEITRNSGVYLIVTSNKSPELISKAVNEDTSMLREGRINLFFDTK